MVTQSVRFVLIAIVLGLALAAGLTAHYAEHLLPIDKVALASIWGGQQQCCTQNAKNCIMTNTTCLIQRMLPVLKYLAPPFVSSASWVCQIIDPVLVQWTIASPDAVAAVFARSPMVYQTLRKIAVEGSTPELAKEFVQTVMRYDAFYIVAIDWDTARHEPKTPTLKCLSPQVAFDMTKGWDRGEPDQPRRL